MRWKTYVGSQKRTAMGIAPLLLRSEGQITAQQSDADPPALPAWHLPAPGLNGDTRHHPVASTLQRLLREIKRTKTTCKSASTVSSRCLHNPYGMGLDSGGWCAATGLQHRKALPAAPAPVIIHAKELKESKQKAKRSEIETAMVTL